MLNENDFFRKKFINYYKIDMDSIEKLLHSILDTDNIHGILLSDYESNIRLSSTNDKKFKADAINNNKIISLIDKNIYKLDKNKKFEEFITTTEDRIYISRHIKWKRDMLLYIIFDVNKTNIALATNRVKHIIIDIEKILHSSK
jgi:hypothetical protein